MRAKDQSLYCDGGRSGKRVGVDRGYDIDVTMTVLSSCANSGLTLENRN